MSEEKCPKTFSSLHAVCVIIEKAVVFLADVELFNRAFTAPVEQLFTVLIVMWC